MSRGIALPGLGLPSWIANVTAQVWDKKCPLGKISANLQDPTTPGMLTQRVMRNIVNAAYAFPSDLELSPACRDLVARLFDLVPERRITARQALEHPWLAGDVLPKAQPPKEAKQSEADIAMIIGEALRSSAWPWMDLSASVWHEDERLCLLWPHEG